MDTCAHLILAFIHREQLPTRHDLNQRLFNQLREQRIWLEFGIWTTANLTNADGISFEIVEQCLFYAAKISSPSLHGQWRPGDLWVDRVKTLASRVLGCAAVIREQGLPSTTERATYVRPSAAGAPADVIRAVTSDRRPDRRNAERSMLANAGLLSGAHGRRRQPSASVGLAAAAQTEAPRELVTADPE